MLSFFKNKRDQTAQIQKEFLLAFYKKYYGYVKKISIDILKDANDAEDIAQEVFLFINSKIFEIVKSTPLAVDLLIQWVKQFQL